MQVITMKGRQAFFLGKAMTRVSVQRPIKTRSADIGPGGKEHNVQEGEEKQCPYRGRDSYACHLKAGHRGDHFQSKAQGYPGAGKAIKLKVSTKKPPDHDGDGEADISVRTHHEMRQMVDKAIHKVPAQQAAGAMTTCPGCGHEHYSPKGQGAHCEDCDKKKIRASANRGGGGMMGQPGLAMKGMKLVFDLHKSSNRDDTYDAGHALGAKHRDLSERGVAGRIGTRVRQLAYPVARSNDFHRGYEHGRTGSTAEEKAERERSERERFLTR